MSEVLSDGTQQCAAVDPAVDEKMLVLRGEGGQQQALSHVLQRQRVSAVPRHRWLVTKQGTVTVEGLPALEPALRQRGLGSAHMLPPRLPGAIAPHEHEQE